MDLHMKRNRCIMSAVIVEGFTANVQWIDRWLPGIFLRTKRTLDEIALTSQYGGSDVYWLPWRPRRPKNNTSTSFKAY